MLFINTISRTSSFWRLIKSCKQYFAKCRSCLSWGIYFNSRAVLEESWGHRSVRQTLATGGTSMHLLAVLKLSPPSLSEPQPSVGIWLQIRCQCRISIILICLSKSLFRLQAAEFILNYMEYILSVFFCIWTEIMIHETM